MAGFNKNNIAHSFSLPWEAILDEYKQVLEAAGKSTKTIDGYLENTKKYFAFLEANNRMKSVEKLGKQELREYIAYLRNRTRWPNNPYVKEDNRGRLSPFSVRANVRDIKTPVELDA